MHFLCQVSVDVNHGLAGKGVLTSSKNKIIPKTNISDREVCIDFAIIKDELQALS